MLSHLGIISNSSDKCYFSLPAGREGDAVTKGNLGSHFRQMGREQITFSISGISQLPSAQNNSHAKVACIGGVVH